MCLLEPGGWFTEYRDLAGETWASVIKSGITCLLIPRALFGICDTVSLSRHGGFKHCFLPVIFLYNVN